MTEFIDITEKTPKEKKETIFTHYLTDNSGWYTIDTKPTDCQKVIYLGKDRVNMDMFACYMGNGEIIIHKGVKGDEFE